jgi:hypothetical protein
MDGKQFDALAKAVSGADSQHYPQGGEQETRQNRRNLLVNALIALALGLPGGAFLLGYQEVEASRCRCRCTCGGCKCHCNRTGTRCRFKCKRRYC